MEIFPENTKELTVPKPIKNKIETTSTNTPRENTPTSNTQTISPNDNRPDPNPSATSSPSIPQKAFFTITINQNSYPIYTTTGTLYETLQNLNLQNNVGIKTRTFPGMGEFVEEINGIANDKLAGKYWIYYVNGAPAQIGISQYTPKQNDIIEWKYEIQKF